MTPRKRSRPAIHTCPYCRETFTPRRYDQTLCGKAACRNARSRQYDRRGVTLQMPDLKTYEIDAMLDRLAIERKGHRAQLTDEDIWGQRPGYCPEERCSVHAPRLKGSRA